MGTYYLWTVGCQMNVADSERLGAHLESLGHTPSPTAEAADIVVVNSCVVRQHAEDRVANKLHSLRPIKAARPDQVVALMGCMVGPRTEELKKRFPHVDVFMRPQVYAPLLELVLERATGDGCLPTGQAGLPTEFTVPVTGATAFIPIIHGCDNFCTFCIVPYRRGRERSRPIDDVVREIDGLVQRGVKEVTLLGQKVDSYGLDFEDGTDLADLLTAVNRVDGLERIRFLTSFPLGVTDKLIGAVARLDKVCEHINIPVQSGDNAVLERMQRGYSIETYRDRIRRIREGIPSVTLSTDVIVGFCGETEQEFRRTLDLLEETRFDVVHVAAYSVRQGTIAARTLPDDVTLEEKKERLKRVEALQENIAREIHAALLGQETEVLVEGQKDGRWEGRSRTNILVHFAASALDLRGELVTVKVEATSPWSLLGELVAVG